jgi:multidrug efflux pump subunit AcrA (membrane-fusion protein)
MRMGIPVSSCRSRTVKAVNVAVGDRVAGGTVLVELEADALRRRARAALRSRDPWRQ